MITPLKCKNLLIQDLDKQQWFGTLDFYKGKGVENTTNFRIYIHTKRMWLLVSVFSSLITSITDLETAEERFRIMGT